MNGIEKLIASRIATALVASGKKITVDFSRGYDTEDQYRDLTDIAKIIEACDAVDECWFMLDAERDGDGAKATTGWVYFIWGNGEDGRTCVSDYTTNLDDIMEPVSDWADTLTIDALAANWTAAIDALKALKRARGNCGASPFEQAACDQMDAAILAFEGKAA